MNLTKLQRVRDELAAVDDAEFVYAAYFTNDASSEPIDFTRPEWMVIPQPHCGTAACVAGWTLMLFEPGYVCKSPSEVGLQARQQLELEQAEATFLFFVYSRAANRRDAVRRLEYLLEHQTPVGYDFRQESWWDPEMEAYIAPVELKYDTERTADPEQERDNPEVWSKGITERWLGRQSIITVQGAGNTK